VVCCPHEAYTQYSVIGYIMWCVNDSALAAPLLACCRSGPLHAGQAHSGMLDCARSVLEHCVPILKQQLQVTPG
jgi:hypothetical protein